MQTDANHDAEVFSCDPCARRLHQIVHLDLDISYSLKIPKSQELVKFYTPSITYTYIYRVLFTAQANSSQCFRTMHLSRACIRCTATKRTKQTCISWLPHTLLSPLAMLSKKYLHGTFLTEHGYAEHLANFLVGMMPVQRTFTENAVWCIAIALCNTSKSCPVRSFGCITNRFTAGSTFDLFAWSASVITVSNLQ